jgi:uncharacterized protein
MKFYAKSRLSENMAETPEGYLICLGVAIARTGEMQYVDGETPIEAGPDGVVVIDRSADEVFRPKTIASFEGKPVTVLHPSDFVSPHNWNSLAKGVIQNVRRGRGEQADDLIADLLITDAVTINLIKTGLREVSCGYEAEYEETGPGRGLQKSIIGNHLALVEEGRAGSSYAINDHKGKGSKMTMKEKIGAIFGKAQDDALKLVEARDEGANTETDKEKKGFVSMDDFEKGMDAFGKKLMDSMAAMMGKKKEGDASTEPTQSEPAKIDAEDDEVAPALEDRLKKVEMMLAKVMEKMSMGAEDEDGEGEIVGDEDGDDDEVGDAEGCEDDEMESMTGDSRARVEILAPGFEPSGKNIKARALKQAYATADGKTVIDSLTGGKPNFKDEKQVTTLFVAVSELLKANRTKGFARTKTGDFQSFLSTPKGAMTIEELNAKHEKFWAQKH